MSGEYGGGFGQGAGEDDERRELAPCLSEAAQRVLRLREASTIANFVWGATEPHSARVVDCDGAYLFTVSVTISARDLNELFQVRQIALDEGRAWGRRELQASMRELLDVAERAR